MTRSVWKLETTLVLEDYNLRNRHVLVVEDEYMIACELAEALREAGARVIGPVGTLDHALLAIENADALDGAVLDLNLRGKSSLVVAERLERAKIPYLFATGYSADAIPPRFAHVTRCEKPAPPSDVLAAVGRAIDLARQAAGQTL